MNRTKIVLVWAGACVLTVGCIPMATPGVVTAADSKKCPPDGVIDDGEDDNNQVALNKGRNGYWYTFLDKAGSTIAPAAGGTFGMSAGGAQGSAHAAHMSGKVGSGAIVYAGMGFNFVDPKSQYNASAYKGISFWAKAGPGVNKVRVKIPDVSTDPDGKVCTECFNDFGTDLELTPTWTQYTIPFASAAQMQGWGSPRTGAITPSKLYGVQFQVNSPGASYDIWVDDVEFTGCP
jgi:endoglucanase